MFENLKKRVSDTFFKMMKIRRDKCLKFIEVYKPTAHPENKHRDGTLHYEKASITVVRPDSTIFSKICSVPLFGDFTNREIRYIWLKVMAAKRAEEKTKALTIKEKNLDLETQIRNEVMERLN